MLRCFVVPFGLFFLTGCSTILGLDDSDEPSEPGDGLVIPEPTAAADRCGNWRSIDVASLLEGRSPTALPESLGSDFTFDTTDGALDGFSDVLGESIVVTEGVEMWLLYLTSLTLDDRRLNVIGSRPLLLALEGDLEIRKSGHIDVGSKRVDDVLTLGAGARSREECVDDGRAGLEGRRSDTYAGGGGGGAFMGPGGDGGDGEGDSDAELAQGGAGGKARLEAPPLVQGGCAGGNGGLTITPEDRGDGGAGGGAIHVFARGSITLADNAAIKAGGAGGAGGIDEAGGGGGGSGGMIALEAPQIVVAATATIAAEGGGGGGGAAINGQGADGENNEGAFAAVGGTNVGMPSSGGGSGSQLMSQAGDGGTNVSGGSGGGGGGGSGVIAFASTGLPMAFGDRVSPACPDTQ